MTERWMITNFVTGEDLPVEKALPFPGEPSQAWVGGWNAGMEGDAKAPPFELSESEAEQWLEGYSCAEDD
jgi:ribosome modulation factor